MQRTELLTGNSPPGFCLLRGKAPALVGVFEPDDPEAWGGPEGKRWIFRYLLCDSCHQQPDAPDRAEQIIRAQGRG